jgi:chromosome partitioning protein
MAEGVRILVFASQKGGSGKTTLSGHIAVEAERTGDGPVALIDTDPQGSLAKWWNTRAAATPAFAQASLEDLDACIEHLKTIGFRLIVVDTPPAVTETIAHVMARADLVVVPTRPSPHDLRAVGPTADIADSLRKPLVFVVNSATARARITSETAVALSQHGVVAPVMLHHRVDFAASMIDGRTVNDIQPDSKSAKEVSGLWMYLRDRLARLYGPDPHWTAKPRADFSTTVLTPESVVEPSIAVVEDEEEDWDSELPAWANVAVATATAERRRQIAPGSAAATPVGKIAIPAKDPTALQPERNSLERRQSDRGPPPGVSDRRQPRAFGRRHAH